MIITDLEVIPLCAPIDAPVATSFGTMLSRQAMIVRIHTDAGLVGIGESWVNFPAWSLMERAATLREGVRPHLIGSCARQISWLVEDLWAALARVGVQSGAPGPIAQAISAVEIALWDLLGKAEGVPLYVLLGGARSTAVPLYASGIGPHVPERAAADAAADGFERVKLKLGFGHETDSANLMNVRSAIGPTTRLVVDVNQGWTPRQTLAMDPTLAEHEVEWLEEPISAEAFDDLRDLRSAITTPVAAGENCYRTAGFRRLLEGDCVDVVQPDVTKVGGIGEAAAAIRMAAAWGKRYAPHCLGSAIGLMASAHLFAAVPGGIALEYDVNPNPLRTSLLVGALAIEGGHLHLSDRPGLGIDLNVAALERYRVDLPRRIRSLVPGAPA